MQQKGKSVAVDNREKNTYVRNRLTEALLELLKEKALQDIPVSELTAAAGVHLVSFYRSYGSKEDILRAHIQGLFRDWMEECGPWDGVPLSELIRG